MIGIGILLAIIGPLLLIPVAWLLNRFVVRPVIRRSLGASLSAGLVPLVSWVATVVLVAAVMAASYIPGKKEFDGLCQQHGVPVVSQRVDVDGFYRTKAFPYEAAGYLDTFHFIEAPDPYKDGIDLRYTKVGDEVRKEEITELTSRYGFEQKFSQLPSGITMTEKRVFEVGTNRELARASNITYHGGPLSLFLGSYGMSSCPDIISEQGSRHFRTFYDLEKIVLGGGPAEK